MCDLTFCKYINHRDWIWNYGPNWELFERDIMAQSGAALISQLWFIVVSTCYELDCVKQLKCLEFNITVDDNTT